MNFLRKLGIRYSEQPKWLRFSIPYGTVPIWAPVVFLTGVVVYAVASVTVYVVNSVISAWENFK